MIGRLGRAGAAAAVLTCALPARGTSFARAAAALVPRSADGALLLDGSAGAEGIRDLLEAARRRAPALDPRALGVELARAVALDLLDPGGGHPFGVESVGPRALVLRPAATGLSAPLEDPARARPAVLAWLQEAGTVRPRLLRRDRVLESGAGRSRRAALIGRSRGRAWLWVASGSSAPELVADLAHAARSSPQSAPAALAALEATTGGAVALLRGRAPLGLAVLSIDASEKGLFLRGPLLSGPGAADLLLGPAPAGCTRPHLACARAALGPGARPWIAAAARGLFTRLLPVGPRAPFAALLERAAAAFSGPAELRIEGIDPSRLAPGGDVLRAVRFVGLAEAAPFPTTVGDLPPSLEARPGGVALRDAALCLQAGGGIVWLGSPCPATAPAPLDPGSDGALRLQASLDTSALSRTLSRLSPLDALRGEGAAAAVALNLLWGPLLRGSGPIVLEGRALAGQPDQVELDLRWPLQP